MPRVISIKAQENVGARTKLKIGIDTGGTFTDFAVFAEEANEVMVWKVASTPEDPTKAFMQGVHDMKIDLGQVRTIVHGTTIATNTILERAGAKLGVITTEGYKDVVELGQLRRYGEPGAGLWDSRWQRPEPYVPRRLRFEVSERISSTGEILKPLNDDDVLTVIGSLKAHQVQAVAVCFLNSYVNPEHEKRAERLLHREMPDVPVLTSSATVPEYGEYERWSSTILGAYVAPSLVGYLRKVGQLLRSEGFRGGLFYMTSSGGVLTEASAPENSIRFLLSGPVAGVSAGLFIGELSGYKNVITCDMGGTSTDICLAQDLKPGTTRERNFGGAVIRTPEVDMATIGAGGGSIAWVGVEGGLRVGPKSAGAVPGPACYGLGGTEVTVTDANLLLGRLAPNAMLGGAMALDEGLAVKAMRSLAKKLNLADLHRLAEGVVTVCVNNMSGAVRKVSIDKGFDPRDFVIIAIGGGGAMHAIPIAEELGISKVVVPPNPGNASALGLLTSELKRDYVRVNIARMDVAQISHLRSLWKEMEDEGRQALANEGFAEDRIKMHYSADIRYAGQSFQLEIPAAVDSDITSLENVFHDSYRRTYGYSREGTPVELVYLRLVASVNGTRPVVETQTVKPGPTSKAIKSRRPIYFAGRFIDCPVYSRELLGVADSLVGPAVVEEYGGTTVVFPGWQCKVDDNSCLILERMGPL